MRKTLPKEMLPILENVQDRFIHRKPPLDFWEIDHGPTILDGFMDLATQMQLAILDGLSLEGLPGGYPMLMVLFSWEADAQSDGWQQYFESSDGEIENVCALYELVGLPDEAESIRRARAAAYSGKDNSAVADAYGSQLGDLDRLEYLTQWFCDNSEQLLYRV